MRGTDTSRLEELLNERDRQAVRFRRAIQREAHTTNDADARARDLLVRHLTRKQLAEFKVKTSFEVVTSTTGYYLEPYREGNVIIRKTTRRTPSRRGNQLAVGDPLCVVTPFFIPIWDHMLSQKLLIEADEELFVFLSPT